MKCIIISEAENKYIHTKYLHSTNIFDKSIQVSGNFGRLITEIMCWYECIFTNESKILKNMGWNLYLNIFLQVVKIFCKKINTIDTKIWTWKDDLQILSAAKKAAMWFLFAYLLIHPFDHYAHMKY